MTNTEYESASVTMAQLARRFEGAHKRKQLDTQIEALEQAIDRLREQRREVINQYGLNKPCDNLTCMGRGQACVQCSEVSND